MISRRQFAGTLIGFGLTSTWAASHTGAAQSRGQTRANTRERILVAGATGRTGRFVVADLLQSGAVVRGLTRNPAGAEERFGSEAEWVSGDVREPTSIAPLFAGVDRVVSALGATERTGSNTPEAVEYRGTVNLIDQALEAGVKQVVIITSLSAGRVDEDPEIGRRFGGLVWKNKAEHYLKDSGMPYTIVGPGGLRDYDGGTQGIVFQPEDNITTGVISRADVGAVMAEAVRTPAALNKTLRIVNDADLPIEGWRTELARVPVDA